MKHFYENVPGMFNFQDLYSRMVKEANDPAYFVEVGAFLGKSAAYMAVEIINSGKYIVFDVVDTFEGSLGVAEEQDAKHLIGDYYSAFLSNVQPAIHAIRPYVMQSVEASKMYADEALDFVYIDAAHDYESVYADINEWLPKIRPGGYIGGHDYRTNCPGVWHAVGDIFIHKNVERMGTSWLVRVAE